MDFRYKLYHKNGTLSFITDIHRRNAWSLSNRLIALHNLEKVDIYRDEKLIATIYG